MGALAQLSLSAMLGSDRKPISVPACGGRVGELIGLIDSSDPEGAALRAAGVLGLYETAGRTLQADGPIRQDCSRSETLPCCSDQAAGLLKRVLAQCDALLPEWLNLAARKGVLVPPVLLPAVLSAGLRDRDIREAIAPVAGNRGNWLARLNPRWRYLLGEVPEADDRDLSARFDEGSVLERQAILKHLREKDPGRARDLLADGFASNPARERVVLLGMLQSNLSMADEAFLEKCLDDRSKEVQAIAGGLLSTLPESSLSRRMTDRLRPLLRFEKKLMSTRMTVDPPESYSPDMRRDGIPEKAPGARKMGQRAWWLMGIVSYTRLEWWESQSGLPAGELIDLVRKSEWRDALVQGWIAAAHTQRNASWALALCESGKSANLSEEDVESLQHCLPPESWERVLTSRFRREKQEVSTFLDVALDPPAGHRHWSPGFSLFVLESVAGFIKSKKGDSDWRVRNHLEKMAVLMSPEVLSQADTGWPEQSPNWPYYEAAYHSYLNVVQIRKDLHEVFKP